MSDPHLQTMLTLVTAQPEDFESLVALRIAAMRESLERIGRFDAERARQRFRATFDPYATQHIEVDNNRVGFVVVKRDQDALLLDHLYIHPSFQRRGLGAIVLSRICCDADQLRLPVRVGALRESDSNRFYIRHGFQLVEQGEFDNYYVRPHRDVKNT